MPPHPESRSDILAAARKNRPRGDSGFTLPSHQTLQPGVPTRRKNLKCEETMQNTLPIKPPRFRRLRLYARKLTLPSLMFLMALPVYAQSSGSDPWDNAVNVLKTAFTGTIATGLSLVAIVVGGLMFAYGEGQSKRMLAGIVFGVGMAIGAVNFMAWLFPG
jgi:type IV secretory pathway VirB2 component (pilin)